MNWFKTIVSFLFGWMFRKEATVVRTVAKRSGIAIAAAVSLIAGFEGLETKAYRDPIGVPTICFGETKGVKIGDRKTVEQCKKMLVNRLADFEAGMKKCTDVSKLPDTTYIALLSFSYNVGTGAFCKSTLVKKLNKGDIVGACNELKKWNKAGGKVLKGLTNRRAQEQKLCLAQKPIK